MNHMTSACYSFLVNQDINGESTVSSSIILNSGKNSVTFTGRVPMLCIIWTREGIQKINNKQGNAKAREAHCEKAQNDLKLRWWRKGSHMTLVKKNIQAGGAISVKVLRWTWALSVLEVKGKPGWLEFSTRKDCERRWGQEFLLGNDAQIRSVESERSKTTKKKAKLAVGGKVTLQRRVK